MDYDDVLFRDERGRINGFAVPGSVNLLASPTSRGLALEALLELQRQGEPQTIRLQIQPEDVVQFVRAVHRLAAQGGYGLTTERDLN